MSFAEMVIKKSAEPIHYLWGRDALGRKIHWLIMCSSQKYTMLKQNFGKNTNVEDYGVLVAKGKGHDVPFETKQMLKEKYDLDFDEYFGQLIDEQLFQTSNRRTFSCLF